MDISKMIAELRGERERLIEAIISLEKLSQMGTPRRGRPPEWSRLASAPAPRNRNGQNGSMSGAASPPSEA
jgi:hypothetical protein